MFAVHPGADVERQRAVEELLLEQKLNKWQLRDIFQEGELEEARAHA